MSARKLIAVRSIMAVTLAAILSPAAALAAPDVTGVWINHTGRGAVEIKQCGSTLCGHVVWVKSNDDLKGCGRQIIGNAKQVGAGLWDKGWIYSPERKKRYDVELKPLDGDRLRVKGYMGSKFFSKTMIWKRAPGDLQRCETNDNPERLAKAPVTTNDANTNPPASSDDKIVKTGPDATAAEEDNTEDNQNQATEQPAGQDEEETADNNTYPGDDGSYAKSEGLDLGGLDVDKFLSRKDGKCKLDLPWVKVSFNCDD